MRSSKDELATVRQSADNLNAGGQEIWSKDDHWNQHKRNEIERFILATNTFSETTLEVLDAGSENSLYDWMPVNRVSADRFYRQVVGKNNSVVCDQETLSFKNCSFNLVFCIGSVLNYVSALEAIGELSRVRIYYALVECADTNSFASAVKLLQGSKLVRSELVQVLIGKLQNSTRADATRYQIISKQFCIRRV